MNKKVKIAVPIVCVLVVGITFYMIFDIKNKVEKINYDTNDIVVENTVEENIIDEENTVNEENTIANDVSKENTTIENVVTQSGSEEVSEEEDAYSTKKLDEAKYLVKKAWGDDDTVYFTTEGVSSEGLYLVAAREKSTTNVKNYFKVNLETKKVEVDY